MKFHTLPSARNLLPFFTACGEPEARTQDLGPWKPSVRVLVADHNADMRDSLQNLLGNYWSVEAVPDGGAALEIATRNPPDLILADIMIPGLSGFELLRRLRTEPATRDIPVILLSKRADEEERIEAMAAGAEDYIPKPFHTRELVVLLGAHLELSRVRREAVRQVCECESKYRFLLDTIDQGFCILQVLFDESGRGVDHRFLQINPTFERHTGLIDAVGKTAREMVPDLEPEWPERFGRVALSGETEKFVMQSKAMGRWFEVNAFRIGDPALRQVGLLFTDITEKTLAQEEAKRSEERYRSLFTAMTEGFALGEPIFDEEGRPSDFRFLEVNDAFEKQSGLSKAIVGEPASQALPELEDHWIAIYNGVALGGEPVHFEQFNRDTARWYEVYCYRPAEKRFAIVFRDITERRRMQEALRENEERFRTTFEQAAVGMAHVGLDGHFLRINKKLCDIVGYSREELQKKTFMEITHAEDLDQDLGQAKRLLRGEIDHYHMEKRYIHRAGHPVWINLTGAVQRAADGSPLFYISVIEDISARKAIEDQLIEAKASAEEASRAKSEFLANMSHEIRTPMTVFMAAIEHLLQVDRNQEHRQLLTMADQAAARLRALIDDILDLSRIEARKMKLEEVPFDLRECVHGAVAMFSLAAREKGLRLDVEIGEQIPQKIVGDSDRIGQVLINLVGNAVKFTPQGRVRVQVRPKNRLLEFSVEDTGIGIAQENQGLLFQSFTQVDSSFTRRYEGSGLGLAISKGLVELMEGELSVQSREGEGSVFTFTLPLKAVKANHLSSAEMVSRGEGERPVSVRILLAEDDPMIREMITTMLAKQGMEVATAATGGEALERWAAGAFDLILMDLQMPEMNGLEATRSIREKEAEGEKRTCIIGLTAHARREIRQECLEAGMDRVVTKPIQMRDLLATIEACTL